MPSPRKSIQEYKLTLFDKYGPDAVIYVRAASWGLYVLGATVMAAAFSVASGGSAALHVLPWFALGGLLAGLLTAGLAVLLARAAGGAYKHVMMSGASTPYQKQYSIQDAMVMQGRIADAIDAYEVMILERPEEGDAYVRAAELHARNGNARRALELLRRVRATPTIDRGQDIYVSFRIIDLYDGPLADRGRAIVELRRLIDLHPGTRAAEQAREGLAKLKAEHIKVD